MSGMGGDEPRVPSTREALESLRAATGLLFRREVPGPVALEKLAGRSDDAAAALTPDANHLDGVRRRLVAASRGSGVTSAVRRDLRDAPWLMWSTDDPLAALPGLMDAVTEQAARRYGAARALIDAWLAGLSRAAPLIEEAGYAIRHVLRSNPDRRLGQWRAADAAFDMFDARMGPGRIAGAILTGQTTVPELLTAVGLDDPGRAVGGYARAVNASVLDRAADAIRSSDGARAFPRLQEFLAPQGKLRFSGHKSRRKIAAAVLGPWVREPSPPEHVRREAQAFLAFHLNDPRMRPEHWPPPESPETRIMRRWLARASFRAFFALIEDEAADRQWRYRSAFWSAYLDRGVVEDVWLALGGQIHANARAVRELNGAYARLKGAQSTHSVLLMRIGDVVLCEWSNVGKLRAWPINWPKAPQMGGSYYERHELMAKGLPFPAGPNWRSRGAPDGQGLSHIGPESGSWQSSAAEFIRQRTSVALSEKDWMPKR